MLLLIDFEATGVDTQTARITEIGAKLVSNDFKDYGATPYPSYSQLVWDSGYPALTPEVVKVTNITTEMLVKNGIPLANALAALHQMVVAAGGVDYIIAYNRKYDERLYKAELERLGAVGLLPKLPALDTVPWLCAMEDIEGNYAFKSWKQMHVALEYGITVNPKSLHRAVNDVDLMREILRESGTTPEAMHQFQTSPWMYVQADVKAPWLDNGKSSAEAKSLGFKWQTAGDDRVFDKKWVKKIKPHQWEDLLNKSTLRLQEIR